MRDPKRIARILGKLQRLWEKWPDLRLGQLVSNVSGELGTGAQVWLIEDDYLEQKIDKVLKDGWS